MRCPKCKKKMEHVKEEIFKEEGKITNRFECVSCGKATETTFGKAQELSFDYTNHDIELLDDLEVMFKDLGERFPLGDITRADIMRFALIKLHKEYKKI